MSKLDKILTADEVHLDNPPLPTRENVASMMWGDAIQNKLKRKQGKCLTKISQNTSTSYARWSAGISLAAGAQNS